MKLFVGIFKKSKNSSDGTFLGRVFQSNFPEDALLVLRIVR